MNLCIEMFRCKPSTFFRWGGLIFLLVLISVGVGCSGSKPSGSPASATATAVTANESSPALMSGPGQRDSEEAPPTRTGISLSWQSWWTYAVIILVGGAALGGHLRYGAYRKTQSLARLAAQIDERTASLQAANERLRQEVAERQQLEAALRASEAMYRSVVERGNDGICILQDGRVKYANPQLERLLGYEPGALPGIFIDEMIAARQRPEIRARYDQRLRGEPTPERYETALSHTSGRQIPVEINAGVVEYDSAPAVLAFVREITAYKQAAAELQAAVESRTADLVAANERLRREISRQEATEASLRESETRFRRVMTSISDHIYMTEITTKGERINRYISPNVQELTGYPPEKFMADWNFWSATLIHPEDRAKAAVHALQFPLNRKLEIEYRLIRADDQIIWVRDSARMERDRDSTVVYGVVSNITGRKKAEAEREHLLQLERRQRLLAEALRRAVAVLSSTLNYEQVLKLILEQLKLVLPHDGANVMLLAEDDDLVHSLRWYGSDSMTVEADSTLPTSNISDIPILKRMKETGRPVIIPDVGREPEWVHFSHSGQVVRSYIGAPIRIRRQVIGFLNVNSATPEFFKEADADRLQALADQAAVAIENARLFGSVKEQRERLRNLATRLAEAEEAERRQLARELHDQAGQNLTALSLTLKIVYNQLMARLERPGDDLDQLAARLETALDLIKETSRRIRNVMDNLRPPALEDYGLLAALRWYSTQFTEWTEVPVTIEDNAPGLRLPPATETALFRIAQEALTNIARHAGVCQAGIILTADEATVRLVIADNGRGFTPGQTPGADTDRRRWGLVGMAERAEAVGGRYRIESAPGEGARVIVELDVEKYQE